MKIDSLLEKFETLNPDVICSLMPQIRQEIHGYSVEKFTAFTERIIELYLNSTFKVNERLVLQSYIDIVNSSATKLIDSTAEVKHELALHQKFTEYEWLKIVNDSKVPARLNEAMAAISRRKENINTVLEYLFDTFYLLDQNAYFEWATNYINDDLDVDVIRDFMRSWAKIDEDLPVELLLHVFKWTEKEVYLRLWPSVIKEADFLLQIQSLRLIDLSTAKNNPLIRSLQNLLPGRDEKRLIGWLKKALNKLTEQILFFTNLEQSYRQNCDEKLQRAAIKCLSSIEELFNPMILLSHNILNDLGGAENLALSFMGFSQNRREAWNLQLVRLSQKTIKRFFLNDLRAGKTPIETIEKLCFGNEYMFRNVISKLDFKSKQFESIEQREKAEYILAHNYASLREEKLLNDELNRRFRRFMRMIHPDVLSQMIPNQDADKIKESVFITEYAVSATAARKMVGIIRNDEIPAEEAFAAREEFINNFHQRRRLIMRRLINEKGVSLHSSCSCSN